jgi:nucleotide sugar dehydrogenase
MALDRATHYLVSVPTLLKSDYTVDLTHLEKALALVIAHAREGCSVVIESSVMVGTTRKLLGHLQDILHCGMSPERVDPGREVPAAHEIPKLVSGLTDTALLSIKTLYGRVFHNVVPVSKPEVAEMTKLYENCYRMINIAYVNEIADACQSHGIDPTEMISAAATKPYGFQAFTPGLGICGHCIPVNPFYLLANNNLPLLQEAAVRMHDRPRAIARKMFDAYIESTVVVRAPRVLVVGVGFKPGQSVLSYSPGIALARGLEEEGCYGLQFYDPLVSQDQVNFMKKLSTDNWNAQYLERNFDIIAVCTKQHDVDFAVLKGLPVEMVQRF